VRHLCGNHGCVRGSHLRKGTPFQKSDDTVFANKASKSPLTRAEWDADSLYDSSSSASLWIRSKNGDGKWRYQRVNAKTEAETLPGPFYLRYTVAPGRTTFSGKIESLHEAISQARSIRG
jgi:hypothetical protein